VLGRDLPDGYTPKPRSALARAAARCKPPNRRAGLLSLRTRVQRMLACARAKDCERTGGAGTRAAACQRGCERRTGQEGRPRVAAGLAHIGARVQAFIADAAKTRHGQASSFLRVLLARRRGGARFEFSVNSAAMHKQRL
jgi:hypothetical protein